MFFFKSILSLGIVSLTVVAGLKYEPFKYEYQIVANSNSIPDMVRLYEYKEKVIETYEANFLDSSREEIEKELKNNMFIFCYDYDVRAYFAYGAIVLMIGSANGACLKGDLRKDSCDETVIRSKVFLFDLFS